MSGNSTRLGVSLAEGNWLKATAALGLIALFVAGAAATSLIVLGSSVYRQALVYHWINLSAAWFASGLALALGAIVSHDRPRH